MSKYKDYVKTLPCCHCHVPYGVDPHHIISIGMGSVGSKAHDLHSMPLCRTCHDSVHREPKEYPQTRWMIETQLQAVKDGVLTL